MLKPNLILASTLTTLLVAGCADTSDSRMPQDTAQPTPATTPLPAPQAAETERDISQRRAHPPMRFVEKKKIMAEDAIASGLAAEKLRVFIEFTRLMRSER